MQRASGGDPGQDDPTLPVSSIWNLGPEMNASPGSSSQPPLGQMAMAGNVAMKSAGAVEVARAQEMQLPRASVSLYRHHAERRERLGRTHAYPPLSQVPFGVSPM